jgi:hypothetical protein
MDAKRSIDFISQALVPAGVIAYAMVYVLYDSFYGGLGLSPSDLGLDWTTVLARSGPYFYSVAVNSALGAVVAYFMARALIRDRGMTVPPPSTLMLRSLQVMLLIWLIVLFAGLKSPVDRAISDAREGKVVLPIFHTITGATLLPIRAEAVNVTRIGPADARSGIASLESRELLYLGSDNGDPASAWFYDHRTQSSLRVPLAAVVIELINCTEAEFPDARCKTVAGRD